MAAGFGSDQRIFAAYVDVPKSRIDVWASPDGLGPFVKLADPFPGMSMVSHSRMAYDQTNGDLIVAAINKDPINGKQYVYMNRLFDNIWQKPVLASDPTTRIDINVGSRIINVGSQTIRMAYGFSFDVGAPSVTDLDDGGSRVNDDAIRLLYTTRDAETKRFYVRGSACRADLGICRDVPEWESRESRGHVAVSLILPENLEGSD
jgi:hypothetical protein